VRYTHRLGFAGDRHDDPRPTFSGPGKDSRSFDTWGSNGAQDSRIVDFEALGWICGGNRLDGHRWIVRKFGRLGAQTGDFHEAEDLVQTTLIKLHAQWRRVRMETADSYVRRAAMYRESLRRIDNLLPDRP